MKKRICGFFKNCAAGICLSCVLAAVYVADLCCGGALFNALSSRPIGNIDGQVWRYITFGLLHESALHLAVNVAGLVCVCSLAEREIGRLRTLLLWLFGSVCGELAFSACVPFDAGCGASVGIFAVAAAFCAAWLRAPARFAFHRYRFDLYLFALYVLAANVGPLAAVEHAFGFAFGMVLSVVLLLIGRLLKPHEMRLQPEPFGKIKSGDKKIEMRLNDEKRKRIAVGDKITFTDAESGEKLAAVVTALYPFPSFRELYAAFPPESLGYGRGEPADPADMERYYDRSQIEKYGVLGIAVERK